MSQLGGAERQISASGTLVAWADSKSVLIRDGERNAGPFGIYQVFLDTLERRRLTQAPVGDGDWRFEVSPDGKSLFYLDRSPDGLAPGATARLMRLRLGGGQVEPVLDRLRPFLWSVADSGIAFVTSEPDFDAIDLYRFSDERVARVGRLGFRLPGCTSS